MRNKSPFLLAISILTPLLGMYLLSTNRDDIRLTFHLFVPAFLLIFAYAASKTSIFTHLGMKPLQGWVAGRLMTLVLVSEGLFFGRDGLTNYSPDRNGFIAFFLIHILAATAFVGFVWSPDVKSVGITDKYSSEPLGKGDLITKGVAFGFAFGVILAILSGAIWRLVKGETEGIGFLQNFFIFPDDWMLLLVGGLGALTGGLRVFFREKKLG